MKFKVNKQTLLETLTKAHGISGKNRNLAITENVLIEAINDSLVIKATDLECSYKGIYPASVENNGKILVNSRKLFEIVKKFPQNTILIEKFEEKRIKISSDNIFYNIINLPSDSFPEENESEKKYKCFFEINSTDFKKMIKRTIFISNKIGEKRAFINGILLEIENIENNFCLKMVSTDSNRLSVVNYPLKNSNLLEKFKVLIPKKGLGELLKFIDGNGMLTIKLSGKIATFDKNYEVMNIRLLEGEFPDYKELLNKISGTGTGTEIGYEVEFDRKSLVMALERMSILISEGLSGVLLIFKKNKVVLIAENIEFGESREEINIHFSEEIDLKVAFNPRFLVDVLNLVEEDNVFFKIIDEEKPCLIEGLKKNSFMSIVMPMRI